MVRHDRFKPGEYALFLQMDGKEVDELLPVAIEHYRAVAAVKQEGIYALTCVVFGRAVDVILKSRSKRLHHETLEFITARKIENVLCLQDIHHWRTEGVQEILLLTTWNMNLLVATQFEFNEE